MSINQNVDLNLSASIMPPVLHMAQGDSNSRIIVATLWDGTSGFTIPSDAVVMVRFGKPDGTGGLYDHTEAGTAITYSGNVVTAPVATQMLSVAGKVQADIEIYQTGATAQAAVKLATFAFVVNVEKSPYPDAEIISSDYYNILSAQISAAVKAGEKADAAIAAAETAQNAATAAVNAKTAAQNAATAAENAKTTAVNSANTANSAKTAAESAKTDAVSAKNAASGSATAAAGSASSAKEDAQNAAQDADDAEAWAVGKRNGVDVSSTDPAYHNNAKYYKDQAQTIAGGEFVSYGAQQSLTDTQQAQARDNINAPAPYEAGDNISISGSVIATKAFPCNPNLLDNWYFGNPVNQRGASGTISAAGYFFDRWKLVSGSVTINSGGIVLNGTIAQVLEYAVGQTVTATVLTPDGVTDVTPVYDDEAKTFAVTAQGKTIKAVKLELGAQQTLAHQENGVWVLNEIPDYGEQLRRCQRYFQVIQQYSAYPAAIDVNGNLLAAIVLPVEMRIRPVFSRENISNNIIDAYFATGGHTGVSTTPAVSGSPGFANLNFKSIPGKTDLGAIARFVDRAFLSADL